MTNEVLERIRFELQNRFYYIEYPDGVPQYIWKDRDGNYTMMDKMGLDHLKASMRRVENDKAAFVKSYSKDLNGPAITAALIPLIEKKLNELREILDGKVNE